jgi:hypothetical protein
VASSRLICHSPRRPWRAGLSITIIQRQPQPMGATT